MACPDVDQLQDMVRGDIEDEQRRALLLHIDTCTDCRMILADATRSQYPEPGELSEGDCLGPFVIERELGRGGMGVVYVARDERLDRRVALKVLVSGAIGTGAARERTLREARAMARLSDPHVVTVHEVDETPDGLTYIAMELVEGTSLSEWLEQGHSPRAILAMFVQAGRGLAAVHNSGFVHRDFKPDNVFVDARGRALVGDFGLARAPTDAPTQETTAESSGPDSVTAKAVVGTPAFMSPEQHRGEPAAARSDQFSFCVALYRALYGQAPFFGDDLASLRASLSQGQLRAPRRLPGVPRRVCQALARGMSIAPGDRFESMEALLYALRPPSTGRWTAALVAAVLVLLVGAATAGAIWAPKGEAASPCPSVEAELDGLWDDATRERVEAAFVATDTAYAEESWTQVARALDDYANNWARAARRTCLAGRASHETGELLARADCLDEQRSALVAVIDSLSRIERDTLPRAVGMVRSLPSLRACQHPREHRTPALPADPELAARVVAIRKVLSAGALEERAGRYDRALTAADDALRNARKLPYPAVEAEAQLLRGLALGRLGRIEDAEDALNQAVMVAQAAEHDAVAIQAWIHMMHFVGYVGDRAEEAMRWDAFAREAIRRLGTPPELEAERLMWLSGILDAQGKPNEALAVARQQVEWSERTLGEDHLLLAYGRSGLAMSLREVGRSNEAAAVEDVACAQVRRLLGRIHPQFASCLNNQSVAASQRGQLEDSLALKLEALEIAEFVGDEATLPLLHDNIGTNLRWLGRLDEARRHFEVALEAGQDFDDRLHAEIGLGALELQAQDPQAARQHIERALELVRNQAGYTPSDEAPLLAGLAECELGEGRPAAALELAQRAADRLAAPQGRSAALQASNVLESLGQARLASGQVGPSIEAFERSLALISSQTVDPRQVARIEVALARALVRADEGARAREVLASARDRVTDLSHAEPLQSEIESLWSAL